MKPDRWHFPLGRNVWDELAVVLASEIRKGKKALFSFAYFAGITLTMIRTSYFLVI